MRGALTQRVGSHAALFDRYARQLRDGDLDARHLVPAQIAADHYRHEWMLSPDVAQYPATVPLADLDQPGKRFKCGRDVSGLLGDHDETIVLVIIGKCRAEAIEYAPPLRRQKLQIDPVLVRQHGVPVRVHDLELVHTLGKSSEENCLTGAKDRRSPGQELV